MAGPDFLQMLFGDQYDPSLPPSAPKPPGYWAAQAVRGGPMTTLGIAPGMIGSGLEAVNENVAMRAQSLLGQIAAGHLPGDILERMAGTDVIPTTASPFGLIDTLTQRNIGRLGQAAKDVKPPFWGDPQVAKQAVSGKYGDVGVAEELAANMSADPTLPFSFGPKLAGRLAGPTGEAISKAVDYPGKKLMEGIGVTAKGAQSLMEKTPLGKAAFSQAPESMAAERISVLEDIGTNLPEFMHPWNEKIETIGRYSIPTYRSGAQNIRQASKDVAQKFELAEHRVWNPVDPVQSLINFANLIAIRNTHQQRMAKLQNDLMRTVDPGDVEGMATVRGAYQAWYDTTLRALDAFEQATPKPAIPRGGSATPAPPAGSGAIHQAINQGIADFHKQIESTRKLVDTVRKDVQAGNYDPDAGASYISDLYHERNQAIVESMKKFYSNASSVLGTTGDARLSEQFAEMGQRLTGLETEAVGGQLGLGIIPTNKRKVFDETAGIFVPNIEKAIGDRMRLVEHLKKGMTETRPIDPQTNLPWDLGGLWRLIGEYGVPIPALGEATGDDLLKAITQLSTTGGMRLEEVRSIARILDKWKSQGDLLQSRPWDLAMGPTERGLVESLSGGNTLFKQPGVGQQIAQGMGLLHRYQREKFIATPSYAITNFIGGGLVNLFHEPQAAKAAMDNFGEMLPRYQYGVKNPGRINNLDLLPPDLGAEYRAWGDTAPPRELVSSFVAANLEAVGNTKLAAERIHPALRFGYNLATAPLDPVNIATGGVGALGYAAGMTALEVPLHKLIRNFAQVSEAALRLGLAQQEIRKTLTSRLPTFMDEIQDVLVMNPRQKKDVNMVSIPRPGEVVPPGIDIPENIPPQPGGPPNPPVRVDGYTDILPTRDMLQPFVGRVSEAGIHFSPQDVLKWGNEVGMDVDDAKNLALKWADHLDAAKQSGVDLANKRHIKYTHYNKAEKVIDTFVPFSRWAIHMLPNYMELVGSAPGTVMLMSTLNHITREEAEKAGLPNSYKRAAEAGKLGEFLAETVYGRPGGAAYVDPSRVLNPYAAAVSGGAGSRFSDSPVEALAQMSPLKPYPTIALLGQLLGGAVGTYAPAAAGLLPMDRETPLPSFSRYAPAAGVIPGMGGPELWQSLVKQLPFMEPYNYREADIQKRLGEMAVTGTGYPDHPVYQAARATPTHPLRQQARVEQDSERGLEQFLGLVFPFGVQLTRPEELKAAAARTNLPQGRRDTPERIQKYEEALDANPWASAHLGAQGSDLATHAQYVFNVFRNPAVLFPDANPAVAERLSRDLANYDAAPSTDSKNSIKSVNPLVGFALQRRAMFIQNDPVAGAYIQWRQTVHPEQRAEGENALLPQFIQWYLQRESKQVKK